MDKIVTNRLPQHIIDNFTNWCLRHGVKKRLKDGSIITVAKYRTYSPGELEQARELSRAKRVIAEHKAQAIIDKARQIGISEAVV